MHMSLGLLPSCTAELQQRGCEMLTCQFCVYIIQSVLTLCVYVGQCMHRKQKREAEMYVCVLSIMPSGHRVRCAWIEVITPLHDSKGIRFAWYLLHWFCYVVNPCAFLDSCYQFVNRKYGGDLSCQDTLPRTQFKGVLPGSWFGIFALFMRCDTAGRGFCVSNEFKAAWYCLIVIGASTSSVHCVHLLEIRPPASHQQVRGHWSNVNLDVCTVLFTVAICVSWLLGSVYFSNFPYFFIVQHNGIFINITELSWHRSDKMSSCITVPLLPLF